LRLRRALMEPETLVVHEDPDEMTSSVLIEGTRSDICSMTMPDCTIEDNHRAAFSAAQDFARLFRPLNVPRFLVSVWRKFVGLLPNCPQPEN